jgi:SulP family sulfate permease
VLALVSWNMFEKREFAALIRASWGDAVVLLATFLLVVFRDLTEGILVGFGLGTLLFLHRMAQAVEVQTGLPLVAEDQADHIPGQARTPYDPATASDPDIVVHRIAGAFFFGSAANVAIALDHLAERPKAFVLDFSAVPLLDSTAASTIESFVRKAGRRHAQVRIAGAIPQVRQVLLGQGVRPPHVQYEATVAEAIAAARAAIAAPG